MEPKKFNYRDEIENKDIQVFQTTSVYKILVLSILTGGLYDLFVVYNFWKHLSIHCNYKISSFGRAFFLIFTNFRLFPFLNNYLKSFNTKTINPSVLAGFYFILLYLSNKLDLKMIFLNEINLTLELITTILTLICTLILVYYQHKINKINETEYANIKKNPWSVANTIWAIAFLLLNIFYYFG